MNKRQFVFCFVFLKFFLIVFIFNILPVNLAHASTSVNANVTSGADASTGSSTSFSAGDITKLGASDDSRIQSNGAWPTTGAYDEGKYIEFIFSPGIPSNAVIESASVSSEFRRSGALTEAKLEVWDGATFTDKVLTTGSINVDHTDTVDIFSLINTASKVNNFKARFLAYRGGSASTTTSHDFIGLSVTYSVPITLSSIAITTPATKLSYTVGDTLDIAGLVVTGTYSDASTSVETITNSNISGFDSSVAVTGQILTITDNGKTATYTININNPPSDLATLSRVITNAQNKYNNATEGTSPGNYAVGSKATLLSAINAASLLTSSDAQSTVDAMVTTLNTAITTFDAAVVPTPVATSHKHRNLTNVAPLITTSVQPANIEIATNPLPTPDLNLNNTPENKEAEKLAIVPETTLPKITESSPKENPPMIAKKVNNPESKKVAVLPKQDTPKKVASKQNNTLTASVVETGQNFGFWHSVGSVVKWLFTW